MPYPWGMAETDPSLVVWYDGACPLCLREIALMRRLDRAGRIRFVNLADKDAACPLDRVLLLRRLHAEKNGTIHSGAAAFAAMWREIPALCWLGWIAALGPVLLLLEGAYRIFLRLRPALQRLAGGRIRKG